RQAGSDRSSGAHQGTCRIDTRPGLFGGGGTVALRDVRAGRIAAPGATPGWRYLWPGWAMAAGKSVKPVSFLSRGGYLPDSNAANIGSALVGGWGRAGGNRSAWPDSISRRGGGQNDQSQHPEGRARA